jgi:hypothetical protein
VADPVAVIDRFVDAVVRDRGDNRFQWWLSEKPLAAS